MAIQSALVTGGAGFIGSHIVETLVAQGTRVAVVDNLSTGFKSNLESLMPAITFHEGDIRDEELLDAATVGAEVVFHEAALVSVPISVDKPIESADINEMGTLKVLDAARRQGCRRVVLASSSAVYGSDPSLPKKEDMKPQPESPYAVQKLVDEYYAGLYTGLYGLETVCLRYFNVFGPRQFPTSPYSGVISLFMDWAAGGQPPVIFGDGQQTRDFINVKDVVRANLLAASMDGASGRVFNVGRGEAITINALWETIAALASNNHAPRYETPRKGDIRHSRAAIGSIQTAFSFAPEVTLFEGLKATYQWFLSTRSGK
ncbi:MAG: SDR family oxidoreductase [Desulfobacterales bacterium]|nr:SDR family oxidoreductase [Desulfobacterales bacterium]MDJ0888550.1 SDR family oxidoreductase [Desulfobacterales bacterium]